MARLIDKVLGTPIGNIGTDITTQRWLGESVIKTQPFKIKTPNTPAQLDHKSKFSLLGKTLVALADIVNIGFSKYKVVDKNSMTAQNAYFKYNFKLVFTGQYPDYKIDYNALTISRGSLIQPSTSFTQNNNSITITQSSDSTTDSSDILMVVIYNTTRNTATFNTQYTRETEQFTVSFPQSWIDNNDAIFAYLCVVKQDLSDAANSIAFGQL